MKEDKKFRYKMRGFRISEEVYKELKQRKEESNLSWNKFIKELLNKYN